MRLTWIRKGTYYLESDCGSFRISRSFTNGEPVYTCWRRPKLGWAKQQGIMGGVHATAMEAKLEFETADGALAAARKMLDETSKAQ